MIHHGDLFDVLPTLEAESIDASVTDPPYGIGFMGKEWDTFAPDVPRKQADRLVKSEPIVSDNPNLNGRSRCTDAECRADITWAQVVKTGRRLCFDGNPVALRTRHEAATHRLIEEVDLSETHWKTCPGAEKFRRGNRRANP